MRFCSNQQGKKIPLAWGDPGDPRLEFCVTHLCQKQQIRQRVGEPTLSGGLEERSLDSVNTSRGP